MVLADITLEEYGDIRYDEGVAQGMEQGMAQGMARGMEQGMAQGMEQGMAQGHIDMINRVKESLKDMDAVKRVLKLTPEEVQAYETYIKKNRTTGTEKTRDHRKRSERR